MTKYLNPRAYADFIIRRILGWQITYSQTGEDLIIDALLGNRSRGFYIDIGAYHPQRLNNTYLFYRKGWHGITIEPNPTTLNVFKRKRPRDTHINIGIAEKEREVNYYIFDEESLNTLSKETADKYVALGHVIKKTTKIFVKPLREILQEFVKKQSIDFLSVDTEGSELEILKSNDWNNFRPQYLIVESLEYSSRNPKKTNVALDPWLKSVGYEKVADTFINSIYKDVRR